MLVSLHNRWLGRLKTANTAARPIGYWAATPAKGPKHLGISCAQPVLGVFKAPHRVRCGRRMPHDERKRE